MGHRCGATNRSKPGTCSRWLVNHDHCGHHRGGTGFQFPSPPSDPRDPKPEEHPRHAVTSLTDTLSNDIKTEISDRIVDYLGKPGTTHLWYRQWNERTCEDLARTAKDILHLRDRIHEAIGKGIAQLLPPGTPSFHVKLVEKIASKIPLPTDKAGAIARGLLIIGIFQCVINSLPVSSCACLPMIGSQIMRENASDHVNELLRRSRVDLEGNLGF